MDLVFQNAPRDGRRALDEHIEHALVGWRRFLCPRVESLPEAAPAQPERASSASGRSAMLLR
jgi:hypothetical protein